LRIGTFGHMGDGNLHPTFLTDERNQEEKHRDE
jgi:glycolate oxidase